MGRSHCCEPWAFGTRRTAAAAVASAAVAIVVAAAVANTIADTVADLIATVIAAASAAARAVGCCPPMLGRGLGGAEHVVCRSGIAWKRSGRPNGGRRQRVGARVASAPARQAARGPRPSAWTAAERRALACKRAVAGLRRRSRHARNVQWHGTEALTLAATLLLHHLLHRRCQQQRRPHRAFGPWIAWRQRRLTARTLRCERCRERARSRVRGERTFLHAKCLRAHCSNCGGASFAMASNARPLLLTREVAAQRLGIAWCQATTSDDDVAPLPLEDRFSVAWAGEPPSAEVSSDKQLFDQAWLVRA
jgi:hypothetical protein